MYNLLLTYHWEKLLKMRWIITFTEKNDLRMCKIYSFVPLRKIIKEEMNHCLHWEEWFKNVYNLLLTYRWEKNIKEEVNHCLHWEEWFKNLYNLLLTYRWEKILKKRLIITFTEKNDLRMCKIYSFLPLRKIIKEEVIHCLHQEEW